MSQLAGIIARRKQALLSAWQGNPLILVQAESPAVLPNLVFLGDEGPSGHTSRIGGRSESSTMIVSRPGNPDSECSVWVASRYSGYRSAYLAFIREVYKTSANMAELAGYDIDHLLNRARSPQDTSFIRIEAIPSAANQSWGRLFEKSASNPEFYANQKRERRTMSWMICAKLAGQLPPNGPADNDGVERLVAFFGSIGLPKDEARTGIQDMLAHAYKFR